MNRTLLHLIVGTLPLAAQGAPAPGVRYTADGGVHTVEIVNVHYRVAGKPRMVFRETTRTREVIDEKGMEARTTVEAWPLGSDLNSKPAYTLTVEGIDPRPVNDEVMQVTRGLEDVEWWSVYELATGKRLFDTFVPPVVFELGGKRGYAGLEVPGDDEADARLRAPEVVAVLTTAAPGGVTGEALITCDDPARARLLRSYFDSQRSIAFRGGSLRIGIRQGDAKSAITLVVPVNGSGLDAARAQMPAGLKIEPWRR